MSKQGERGWTLIIVAAAILLITTGSRQTMGLFVSPLNSATGIGIVTISFAIAVGQLMWGVTQPLFGIAAERFGAARVITIGCLMVALGTALTPFVRNGVELVLALGVLSAAGAGAGSFALLMGLSAQRLAPQRRAFAGGFINAGGSLGQFVFAPVAQVLISGVGWVSAMLVIAASALAALPLVRVLDRQPIAAAAVAEQAAIADTGARDALRRAFADRSYLLIHAGFFTCGFHVAFLVTHLPGEVQLCGLPAAVSAASIALIGLFNIAGSLASGSWGQRYRMKSILFWMYATRAVAIAVYLLMPKTAITFYVFAAVLGFTFLATVAPTAGLVGKLFGPRRLATLFGMTLFTHQVGAFLGAYLGGLAVARLGSYDVIWYADIALALFAALSNLPIREQLVGARAAAAA